MSDCINKDMGRLLHDYELDILSAEDKQRFEIHLYECDHCYSQVKEFMDVARIIRHDDDAQSVIRDIVGEPDIARKKSFPFTRLLIAAIIVLAIGVPAWWYSQQSDTPVIMQSLELLSSRAGGSDIIYLEKGGDVEISFFFAESFQGEADLVISSIDGDTVVNMPGFSNFNENGLGSITLPVSKFSDGHYMLTMKPDPQTGLEERVYMFTVK